MTFPTLETERLVLRQIKACDVEALFETFSSEEAMLYFGMYPFTDKAQAEQLIENFQKGFEQDRMIRWAIVIKASDQVIGTCGFHAYSKANDRTEVGFEINPVYQGKGYMTEALKCILDYGFENMGWHRIEGLVYPENIASQRTLEKQGFTKEGLLRDYMVFRKKHQDLLMYSLLKGELK